MHTKERVPLVLAAVAGTARAMRRHKRRTLAAGVALLLVTPLLTGSGVDAFTVNALALGVGALMLRRFMGARNRKQALQALRQSKVERENTMTTAVMNYGTMVVGERPRRSLEELVDRVMDALFASNREQSTAQSVAKSVHDARRLRKAGDLDGALTVFASVEPDKTAPNETRWAYAEWQDLVRRAYGDREVLVYSQGTGRAGQASVQAQPAGTSAPERRWVMVVANTQVDLEALKSRHSLADVVEASGVQLRGRGRVRQGVCPFHQESEGSFTVYGDTERWYCFGCGQGKRRAGLHAGGRGPQACTRRYRGWTVGPGRCPEP